MRRTPQPVRPEPRPWSRDRLLLTVALIGVAASVLLAGALLVVRQATRTSATPTLGTAVPIRSTPDATVDVRDRIADEPMPSLDPSAATRPDPALRPAPALGVPAPSGLGPSGIATFSRTPEGAVAQLAAIDIAVLEAMSLPFTGEVHAGWVLPGGPTLEEWDLTRNVAGFLRGARQGSAKDDTTVVTVAPVGAMVKGVDGPDWVAACVLLDVQASIRDDYRMGWGHCHRMQWTDGRWQIAPGAQPATAPSAWPGSNAAVAAGWLTWQDAER